MKKHYSYTENDIQISLTEVGISDGDSVFLTTSLGLLGVLERESEAVKDIDLVCKAFHGVIKCVIGSEGTIFVPTYSYTAGNWTTKYRTVFRRSTPSKIGPFGNYFLELGDVVRSKDPMVSVSGLGVNADILTEVSSTSYGYGCIFDKLLKLNRLKILNIGLGPNWTPFIHFVDFIGNSPFRYAKVFKYEHEYNGEREEALWLYHVPARIDPAVANAHNIGREAHENGIYRSSNLGRGRIFAADYCEYFEFVTKKHHANTWCLATGPACDVISQEQNRVPCKDSQLGISYGENISYNETSLVERFKKYFSGSIKKEFITGNSVCGIIVPEQYEVIIATLTNLETGNVQRVYPLPFCPSIIAEASGRELTTEYFRDRDSDEIEWLDRASLLHKVQTPKYNNETYRLIVESETLIGTLAVLKIADFRHSSAVHYIDSMIPLANVDYRFSRTIDLVSRLSHDKEEDVWIGSGWLGLLACIEASNKDPVNIYWHTINPDAMEVSLDNIEKMRCFTERLYGKTYKPLLSKVRLVSHLHENI